MAENQGQLSPEARIALLKVARNTLKERFNREREPVDRDLPELAGKNGAFVTLHKNKALRGCIGIFTGKDALHSTVASMSLAAAFDDPRFPPLREDELDRIDIEISVLSPLQRIESVEEIEVGRDGIYLIKGYNRGVLLPQVATEYGWDRETFLSQTCVKAGLRQDCWKQGAEIYTFVADIFHED